MPRPPRDQPLLDQDTILDAAYTIVQQNGVEGLSIRRLAQLLGVSPGSLYHWFPNKKTLLQGVFIRALETFVVPSITQETTWEEGFYILATTFRELWETHPTLIPPLFGVGAATDVELTIHDYMHQLLLKAGVPPERIPTATLILPTFLFGFLDAMEGGAFSEERVESINTLLQRNPEHYPHLSPASTHTKNELYSEAVQLLRDCILGLSSPQPNPPPTHEQSS